MYKVQEVEKDGKKAVLIDISDCCEKDFEKALLESAELIRKFTPGTALVITKTGDKTPVFTDRFNFIDYLKNNSNYVKATAVSFTDRLRKSLFEAVLAGSGRDNVKLFDSHEEAEEWLFGQ